MTEHRHPVTSIAVDELRLDPTGPAAPDSSGADDRRRRRAAGLAVAVVSALAAAAVAIAVVDPGAEQAAPTTTAPGPVRATGRAATRAILADPPPGFRVAAVRELDGGAVRPQARASLYRAPAATLDAGEWVLAVVSPVAAHLPLDAGFVRPAGPADPDQPSLAVGQGALGDETAAFDSVHGRVTVIANDLPPGTAAALARRAHVAEGTVALEAADVPAGLAPAPTWHLPRGLGPAAGLAGDAGPPDGWNIEYRSPEGAAIEVTVSSVTADQATSVASMSTFFLDGVSHGVVRGQPAVFGRADETMWAVWTEGTTLITVSSTGIGFDSLARVPGSLRLASDANWDDGAWASAALTADRTLQHSTAGRVAPSMHIVGRGTLRGATSWWDVVAAIDGTELVWTLRTGHNPASLDVPGDAIRTPLTTSLALSAAGHQRFTLDPPGADAGELADWYAAAVAVGDSSLAGARLLLTTDGPNGTTSEAVLRPVRGFDGYVVAATALPWTDHYTVQVVDAAGAVLESTTDTARS